MRPPYFLLQNLCESQKATVRARCGTMEWFIIGKGVWQGCRLSHCLFILYEVYIKQNARIGHMVGLFLVFKGISVLFFIAVVWTYLQGSSGDPDLEKRLVGAVWEGEGGTNWQTSMETYRLLYVKWIASGNLLCDTGSSIHCSNLEGWVG